MLRNPRYSGVLRAFIMSKLFCTMLTKVKVNAVGCKKYLQKYPIFRQRRTKLSPTSTGGFSRRRNASAAEPAGTVRQQY